MVAPSPELSENAIILNVGGYALPGVLNDCNAPASAADTLESNGQTLRDIAATMAGFFGIPVVFDGDPGPVFDRVSCGKSKKVLSFLAELAGQRNFIINSTPTGALRFVRSVGAGSPVAVLEQGRSPVQSVAPSFNPQEYYSHVTGFQPVDISGVGTQYTAKNSFLAGVIRPLSFQAPDTSDSNVPEAVNAKIGRMFGNIVSYSVEVSTWRDPNGNLWEPNTTIKLTAPGAMVYSQYEFIIRGVRLTKTGNSETAVLTLTLPGAFSGEIPGSLPWDD